MTALEKVNKKLEAARKRTQELRDQLKAQEEINDNLRNKFESIKQQIENGNK